MFSLKRIFFTFLITIKLFIFKSKQNNRSEDRRQATRGNNTVADGEDLFGKKCSFIIHFRREQFIKCVKMDNLVCVEDFEKAALKIWDENAAGYYTR